MSIDNFLLSSNTTELNYPKVRPTLDLNFARVKALDPRITFTRASGGSYVGADGLIKYAGVNEPRFDHNPVTGESLGLLVEEPRTNNIVPSNPSSAGWAPTPLSNYPATSGITFNQANALTGGNTAASFNSGASQLNYGAGTINSGTTLSFYITGVTATVTLNMTIPSTGGGSIVISSSYGITFSNTGGSWLTNVTISNVGKGWYRVSATINATSGNCQFNIVGGNSGVLLDLFQLEAGAFPTSYIPTVASSRTRAADTAQITGSNFSSWYRQDEGTLFSDVTDLGYPIIGSGSFWKIFASSSHASGRNGVGLTRTSGGALPEARFFIIDQNAASVVDLNTTAPPTNARVKSAIGLKSASYAATSHGNTTVTSSAAVPPTYVAADTLAFGQGYNTTLQVNSCLIARLTYYPKRLPDATLQLLTR